MQTNFSSANQRVNTLTFSDGSQIDSSKNFTEEVQFKKRARFADETTLESDLIVEGVIYGSLADLDVRSKEYTDLRTGWPWPVKNPDGETYDPNQDSLWTHLDIIEKAPYASETYVNNSLENTLSFIRILPIADGGDGYPLFTNPAAKYSLPVTTLATNNLFIIRNDTTTQQFFKFQDSQTAIGKVLVALDNDGTVGWGDAVTNIVSGSETIQSNYGQSLNYSLSVSDTASGQPLQTMNLYCNLPSSATNVYHQMIQNSTIALLSGRFSNGFAANSQPPVLVGCYTLGSEGILFQSGYLNGSNYTSGYTRLAGGKKSYYDQSVLLHETGVHISSDSSGNHLWGKTVIKPRINHSSTDYAQPPGVLYPNGPVSDVNAELQVGLDENGRNGYLSIFGEIQLKPFGGVNVSSSTIPSFLKCLNAEGDGAWTHLPIQYILDGNNRFDIISRNGRTQYASQAVTKCNPDGSNPRTFAICPKVNNGNWNPMLINEDILLLGCDSTEQSDTTARLVLSVWTNYADGIAIRPSNPNEETSNNLATSGYTRIMAASSMAWTDSTNRIPSQYLEINRQGVTILNGNVEHLPGQKTSTKVYGSLKVLTLRSSDQILNNHNPAAKSITGGFQVGESSTNMAVASSFYGSLKYNYPGTTFDSSKTYVLGINSADGNVVWTESVTPVTEGDEISIVKKVSFAEDISLYNEFFWFSLDLGLVPAAITGALVYAWASNDKSGAVRTEMLDTRSQYYWRFNINGVFKYPLKLTYETAFIPDLTIANTSRPIYDSQNVLENNNIKTTSPISPATLSIFGNIYFRQPSDNNSGYLLPALGTIPICTQIVNKTYSGQTIDVGLAKWTDLGGVIPTTIQSEKAYTGPTVDFGAETEYYFSRYGQPVLQPKTVTNVKHFGRMFFRQSSSSSNPGYSPLGYLLGCIDETTGELGWIPPGGGSGSSSGLVEFSAVNTDYLNVFKSAYIANLSVGEGIVANGPCAFSKACQFEETTSLEKVEISETLNVVGNTNLTNLTVSGGVLINDSLQVKKLYMANSENSYLDISDQVTFRLRKNAFTNYVLTCADNTGVAQWKPVQYAPGNTYSANATPISPLVSGVIYSVVDMSQSLPLYLYSGTYLVNFQVTWSASQDVQLGVHQIGMTTVSANQLSWYGKYTTSASQHGYIAAAGHVWSINASYVITIPNTPSFQTTPQTLIPAFVIYFSTANRISMNPGLSFYSSVKLA